MLASRRNQELLLVAAVVFGILLILFSSDSASAQPAVAAKPAPASAELKRVVGRVEVLRKGQTQWVPAVVGDRLEEGDDIRAFSGAQAQLGLPDTSTAVIAQNSRLPGSNVHSAPQSHSR